MKHPAGQAVVLCLIIAAATIPFLSKPFHIDDPLYLAVARQILKDPWDPFGAQVMWEKRPESLFDADFNPPLWSYLMAGVLAWTGEPQVHVQRPDLLSARRERTETSRTPELALHVLESVFVAAAIVALYLLSRRFVPWPLTATALVALSPALLPGQNVMLEGPLLAFWLWASWCYLRAGDRGSTGWFWLAGLLAALAALTKYSSLLLLVVLGVHAAGRRRWHAAWMLVPPAAALALWCLHNLAVYDRIHLAVILSRVQTGERQPQGLSLDECWGRLLACLRGIGAITALFIPALWAVRRRRGLRACLVLVVAGLFVGLVGKWDMARRLRADRLRLETPVPGYTVGGWLRRHSACIHAVAFGALGVCTVGGVALATLVGVGQGRRPRDDKLRSEGSEPVLPGRWRAARRCSQVAQQVLRPAEYPPDEEHQSRDNWNDERLLWLWAAAVLLFCILAVPFLAVRHLLVGVPPLVWLALRRWADCDQLARPQRTRVPALPGGQSGPATRLVLLATTVITVSCGYLVAKADYDFAEWHRHLAVDVGARSVARARLLGLNVWYTGHWGWAYYAERAGMRRFLKGRSHMQKGDLLLLPIVQTWQMPSKPVQAHLYNLRNVRPPTGYSPTDSLARRVAGYALGSVRTITHMTQYYAFDTKNLPWRFTQMPLDELAIAEYRSVAR